jgi:hypothetical protein
VLLPVCSAEVGTLGRQLSDLEKQCAAAQQQHEGLAAQTAALQGEVSGLEEAAAKVGGLMLGCFMHMHLVPIAGCLLPTETMLISRYLVQDRVFM